MIERPKRIQRSRTVIHAMLQMVDKSEAAAALAEAARNILACLDDPYIGSRKPSRACENLQKALAAYDEIENNIWQPDLPGLYSVRVTADGKLMPWYYNEKIQWLDVYGPPRIV